MMLECRTVDHGAQINVPPPPDVERCWFEARKGTSRKVPGYSA